MRLFISPYEISARSPAAMLALLLADSAGGAVTLLPRPLEGEGAEHVGAALRTIPRFGQFMDTWRWTQPLWNEGVLSRAERGESPLDDVRDLARRLGGDPGLAGLRRLIQQDLFESPEHFLDSLSRDLMRGGADPSVCIPMNAGFERFAARMGLPMVQTARDSAIADRLARPAVGRFSASILLGAEGDILLSMRADLAAELGRLRAALSAALESSARNGGPELGAASRELNEAFRERLAGWSRGELGELGRVRPALVLVTARPLGVHEALMAALGTLLRTTDLPGDSRPQSPDLVPQTGLVLTVRPTPWDLSSPILGVCSLDR